MRCTLILCLIFKSEMKQSSPEANVLSTFQTAMNPQNTELASLELEIQAFEERVLILLQCSNKERELNEQIQILQLESQQHYETLRKLTMQYNENYTIYSSKIDNRSEDICDERDRTESNIYYLQQQNQRLGEECKRKVEQRRMLEEQVEKFDQKKEKLMSILLQESCEVAQKIKANKLIEESIKATREENQRYQEEIFMVDIKSQNLKKYGYEIVPQKIIALMEAKEQLQKEIKEVHNRKQRQIKTMSKFVKVEAAELATESLARQQQKKEMLESLKLQNAALKQENDKLNQIKYSFEWNPNLEIKQLEINLLQQEKKIANIEKDIANLKKKAFQSSQKIKEYSDFASGSSAKVEASSYQEIDSPRKHLRQKSSRKEKVKSITRPIFEELKNDLEHHKSKKYNWKDLFKFGSKDTEETKIITLSEFTYKIKKSSQKLGLFIVFVLLLGCTFFCHKTYRK